MTAVLHCETIQALEETWTANMFVICLDKPESELNTIDLEFGIQFGRALYLAKEKANVGEIDVLVVCSAKEESFVAGADILLQLKLIGIEGEYNGYTNIRQFQSVLCLLESLPVPTIAVLNGTTLGGGLELALACDFRVADSTCCKQIGLPEVKLGVLPGGGGCVRLPRLIGFRKAVEMMVTGQTIDSKKAVKLGVVDQLLDSTQTVLLSGENDDGSTVYEYQWLSEVLRCMDGRAFGKRPFEIAQRKGTIAVNSTVNVAYLSETITQEMLVASVSEDWQECEKKAELKYQRRKGGCCQLFWNFILHALVYTIVFFQLWRKVGFKMVAPYTCLRVTLRCLYAGTWQQAMAISAHGMASLVTSAESSSLMNLFLITRKLKNLAVKFGLKASESIVPFEEMEYSVVVSVSNDMLALSTPFVQSLLFNEIPVIVAIDKIMQAKFSTMVLQHFNYALKRHYISRDEMNSRMGLLSVCDDEAGVMKCLGSDYSSIVVISASTQSFPMEEMLQQYKVVVASLSANCVTSGAPYPMLMNVGDPSRKNTLTVEVTPGTNQVPLEHVRCLSSLVVAIGRIPVVTPPTPLTACGLHMLHSHWSLAVSLVSVYNMSPSKVDKALLAAGYSMGPFQTMAKFGCYYLPSREECRNGNIHLSRLRKFIETKKILPGEKKQKLALSSERIADLFTLNLILSALYVQQANNSVSEAALDTLCVAGLVQFPPTEAGPLNFASRSGQKNTTIMFNECKKTVPFIADVGVSMRLQHLFSDATFQQLFDPEPVHNEQSTEGVNKVLEEQKAKLVLLSGQELKIVGCTHGLENKEVFLLPLVVFISVLTCVFVLFWAVVV